MVQVEETTIAQVQLIITRRIEISATEISPEIVMEIEDLWETEVKIMVVLVGTKEVGVEVDLIQAQMSEDQE